MEKRSVRLQWMPSASRTLAAWQLSHVVASLINTRDRATPSSSKRPIRRRAFAIEPAVSNESAASTSVETSPGTTFNIAIPNATTSRSQISSCNSSPLEPKPTPSHPSKHATKH
eukprot:GHVT01061562.1.p1 GENE.GHVT01061562.1~~GHVT01061562.1.p1  ORF type:complete len:114 (-),score=18.57 GHVT01061562.1:179-520(-)